MINEYSAHPALAAEQLERTNSSQNHFGNGKAHCQHRLHNSTVACSGSGCGPTAAANACSACLEAAKQKSNTTTMTTTTKSAAKLTSAELLRLATADANNVPATKTNTTTTTHKTTLPNRTDLFSIDDDDNVAVALNAVDDVASDNAKDCVDCAPNVAAPPLASEVDGPDHLQQRFSRPQYDIDNAHSISDGCASGLSSVISSPSVSTVSSPLSTPTRLAAHLYHSHKHCCQQQQQQGNNGSTPASANACCAATPASSPQHQHHHHHHHHHNHHAPVAVGCKKLQKLDPRLGPSPYRQLLPIALCILSFATVFSILIVYMDTTEIRHQQFRLNMSRDYELYSVAQDDPTLIAFLREIHMRKYPMHFLKNRETPGVDSGGNGGGGSGGAGAGPGTTNPTSAAAQHYNFNLSAHHDELAAVMAHYVADLVGGKMNGAVIQSLSGSLGALMTAPWLAETLNWAGIIVEPEPRRFFTLRKQNAQHATRMQLLHACISPNPYPKEVTIHNEESEVRINSLFDEETSWFNSRVKCFPLYTIMLAYNRVEYDLLSLGVHGHELEILQTLPFDKVKIEVISIHLQDDYDNARGYIQTITKFLSGKAYKLQKKFGRNYFYQRIKAASHTRKKDILLLKTP